MSLDLSAAQGGTTGRTVELIPSGCTGWGASGGAADAGVSG